MGYLNCIDSKSGLISFDPTININYTSRQNFLVLKFLLKIEFEIVFYQHKYQQNILSAIQSQEEFQDNRVSYTSFY